MFLVSPYSYPAGTMLSAAQRVGVTSGLVLCLDAGDINSYDGTSQTWTDVSGNSNNFYRGSGSGSDGFDPTFHGSAGAQSSSEYFQSDGGDAFWQTSSQTYMSTWHKANATFTVAGWVYLPSAPTTRALGLCRNFRDYTDLGVEVHISDRPVASMFNAPGSGSAQSFSPGSAMSAYAQWQFACISFAEGTGASFAHSNGTIALLSSDSYSSPSSSTAPNGVSIMGIPDTAGTGLETSGVQNENGQRVNSVMAWNRALSQAEVTGLYTATKARFGL